MGRGLGPEEEIGRLELVTGGAIDLIASLNPIIHFDAAESMLVAGGGQAGYRDSVAALADLSGNGNDATQGTALFQPTAAIGENSFLEFDGVDDFFTLNFEQDFAGTIVVATTEGSLAYEAEFPQGVQELSLKGITTRHGDVGGSMVRFLAFDRVLADSEKEEILSLLEDSGAVRAFSGSLSNRFNDNSLTTFPLIDTSSVSNMRDAWLSNNLTTFPLIDTSNVTDMINAWRGNNLTTFPLIDTSSVTSMGNAWRDNNLTTFPLIDTSSVTNMSSAWFGNNLTTFPLIDTSSVSNMRDAWFGNNLTTFPLIDTSNVTDMINAWLSNNLTTFPLIDTSNVTDMINAWRGNNLTTFPLIDTSNVTDMSSAWRGNNLTTFPLIDTSNVTDMSAAWLSNNPLAEFPRIFDTWSPNSISNGVFNQTWGDCALNAQSVENILDSIDGSGNWATNDGTSGGNTLADAVIDMDSDGDPLTPTASAAINSLKNKGWGINLNGVLQ